MLRAANQRLVRNINITHILHLVKTEGPMSRSEVAKRLGISQTAVSRIVAELKRSNFVVELPRKNGAGSVGRQPVLLAFNDSAAHIASLVIGRRDSEVALTDLKGKIITRERFETGIKEGRDHVLREAIVAIRRLLRSERIDPLKVAGLGVIVPGLIDASRGVVRAFSRGWENFNLRDYFQEHLHISTYVEDDSKAIALAEYLLGCARGKSNVVCLCVTDAGPSAGIIYNGQVVRGMTDSAGEVGTVPVGYYIKDTSIHKALYDKDKEASFDEVIRTGALVETVREEMRRGLRIHRAGEPLIPSAVTVADVVRSAEEGNGFTRSLLTEFGQLVGVICINIINFFNPELLILHGEMFWGGGVVMETVKATVRRHPLSIPISVVDIAPSSLKQDAIILGAVSVVLSNTFHASKLHKLLY